MHGFIPLYIGAFSVKISAAIYDFINLRYSGIIKTQNSPYI